MEVFRKLFANQGVPFDYDARIDELIELHVPGSQLEFMRSSPVGGEILIHAMIEANNAAAAGVARTNPVARPSFREGVWPLVDHLTSLIVRTGREELRQMAVMKDACIAVTIAFLVVSEVLKDDEVPKDVLELPELRQFVGGLYGIALELGRRDPDLARWILRFDMAARERWKSEARLGDDAARKGKQLPALLSRTIPNEGGADAGLATAAGIHKTLMIDEPWTVWQARGFTWLPHRLQQTVSATRPFESRGVQVSCVEGCTPVVENVQAPAEQVDRLLAELNLMAIGSAYVFWPDERRIVSVLAQLVHDQTVGDRIKQLSSYLILQACEAERVADWLAHKVSGEVAYASHPEHGARTEPDDMLGVLEGVYRPRGEGHSQFAVAKEFEAVVQMVRESPFATAGSSADGVCVEVPFDVGGTTLIELSPGQRHPELGSGLAVRTSLPFGGSMDQIAAAVAHLGRLQLATVEGGAYLGAWCIREEGERAYASWMRFVPNADFRPGYVLDIAMGEINRALWADRVFFPELAPRNAWPIMRARVTGEGLN
jgi:hypothetical protein